MKKSTFFFALIALSFALNGQILTLTELVASSRTEASIVGDNLTKKNWAQHGYEDRPDNPSAS